MDIEEIGLNFDEQTPDTNESKDRWQSDSQSASESPETSNKEQDNDTIGPEEGVKRSTGAQLKRLMEVNEPQSKKRQRVSESEAIPDSQKSKERQVTKKTLYTCPTKIAEIFNRKISSKDLCALSAIKDGSPDAVIEVIPDATVDQICKMCKL